MMFGDWDRSLLLLELYNRSDKTLLTLFMPHLGTNFFDDKARPHRATTVEESRKLDGIPHLALSPHSSDLNSIVYACDILQRRFTNHVPPLTTSGIVCYYNYGKK